MQIDVVEGVRIGRLQGDLTHQEAVRIELSTIDDGLAKVVLDFSNVRLITAAALASFVQAAKKRRGKASQLHFVNLNGVVKYFLTLPTLHLEGMFKHCADEREAITSLQKVRCQTCPGCGGTGTHIAPYPLNICETCGEHGEVWQ